MRLEFFDAGNQLRHRSRDVRQLNDIGIRCLGQFTEFREVVGRLLLRGQELGEAGQHTARQRYVARFHCDPGGSGISLNNRQQRMRRQSRRLVSDCVDDFCFIAHNIETVYTN